MVGFLDSVEAEYNTRNLYEVLGISKTAKQSDIKRAYHKLSLKVHPDRAKPDEVEAATRKFQIICKIYLILSDEDKRGVYDDTGTVDDDDLTPDRDWNEYWRLLFPQVTIEDVFDFEKKYKGSEEEAACLKTAYLDFEGDMDKIMDEVLCAVIEDEPRFRGLIAQWIAEGSVPSYPLFVDETDKKRKKRKRKYDNEAKEVEKMSKELGIDDEGEDGLKALIQAKQKTREKELGTFFDKLEQKYASKKSKQSTNITEDGEIDDEEVSVKKGKDTRKGKRASTRHKK